ncbi:MAG: hypothetical protein F4Y26_02950 [Gammaproteobacteria bacterium]|nr:hypothetical protein [Gammaproteobacteria bacterium]
MRGLLTPQEVAAEIRRRSDAGALRIFWVDVGGQGRDAFAADLLASADGDRLLVPWRLGIPNLFTDSNTVMEDVGEVLEAARDNLEEGAAAVAGVDLVLLAKRGLELVDASSPIELPTWFPVIGARGQTVTTTVEELTWDVVARLDEGRLDVTDISRLLYELDRALLDRLREALATPRKVQSIAGHLFKDTSIPEELEKVDAALARVSSGRYRPSARPGFPSLVARIWRHVNETSPEALVKVAKALAQALEPDIGSDETATMSMMTLLNRTSNPLRDEGTKWCFNLMITTRSACQLLTAAAHPAEYPVFPVALQRTMSRDLRRSLDRVVAVLRHTR